jgi:hypothetical protein
VDLAVPDLNGNNKGWATALRPCTRRVVSTTHLAASIHPQGGFLRQEMGQSIQVSSHRGRHELLKQALVLGWLGLEVGYGRAWRGW